MLFATVGQGRLFLWMAAAGVAIGVWYALMDALRRLICAGFWLSLACDLAFGAGCAVLFCAALVAGNYGRLRLFEVLAAALGAALGLFGLCAPLRAALRRLGARLRRIFTRIAKYRLFKVIFK